ncbi:hypothetical protein ACOZ38_29175 [Sphaerisporangium viridialbum]|uniref:hypothetical protein n=1 Tax=Sphaerisporangium viridialbum TaxID=46189 RepID=UPI003C70A2F9
MASAATARCSAAVRALPSRARARPGRRAQAALLVDLVGHLRGLEAIHPGPGEEPNGYSALWQVTLLKPRAFAERLDHAGVHNSVGSFGLRAASAHPACQALRPAPCPVAEQATDGLLAVVLRATDAEHDLRIRAETIQREAQAWTRTAT